MKDFDKGIAELIAKKESLLGQRDKINTKIMKLGKAIEKLREEKEMSDLLDMEKLNSLPQPLWIRQWGRTSFDWPIYEICVETGFMSIDVCGKLDNLHIGDVAQIRDDHGNVYDSDFFYLE